MRWMSVSRSSVLSVEPSACVPEQRRGIDWPLVRHARGAEGELQISGSIVARVLDNGERAVILDDQHLAANPTESIISQGIRSALCVPLEYRSKIIGVLYGDCVTAGRIYTPEDVDFLAALARQVSIGIVNARLHKEHQVRVALEREIDLARSIQQNLFPMELPAVDNLRVAAANRPGRYVSGDYYDVIDLGENRFALLVAGCDGQRDFVGVVDGEPASCREGVPGGHSVSHGADDDMEPVDL